MSKLLISVSLVSLAAVSVAINFAWLSWLVELLTR